MPKDNNLAAANDPPAVELKVALRRMVDSYDTLALEHAGLQQEHERLLKSLGFTPTQKLRRWWSKP
jgi:hypothetical protein